MRKISHVNFELPAKKKSLTVTHWTLCNNNHQRKTNLQCHLHQEKNDKKINWTFIHITFVSNHKKVSLYKNLDIKISTNDKKWKGTSWKLKSLLLFIVLKKDFLFILFTLFNFLSLHLTQLTQSFPVTSNWLSHISIVQKWLNENSFARKDIKYFFTSLRTQPIKMTQPLSRHENKFIALSECELSKDMKWDGHIKKEVDK